MSKPINATLCGQPVRIDRPTLQFQEQPVAGGGFAPAPGDGKWLPMRCEPAVELSEPAVLDVGGDRWSLTGARWEHGLLHIDSAAIAI